MRDDDVAVINKSTASGGVERVPPVRQAGGRTWNATALELAQRTSVQRLITVQTYPLAPRLCENALRHPASTACFDIAVVSGDEDLEA